MENTVTIAPEHYKEYEVFELFSWKSDILPDAESGPVKTDKASSSGETPKGELMCKQQTHGEVMYQKEKVRFRLSSLFGISFFNKLHVVFAEILC